MGGADKIAGVKDFTIVLGMAQAGAPEIKMLIRGIEPGVFRADQTLPTGTVVAYSDGKAGWLALPPPQGVIAMPPPVLKQVQGEMFREWTSLILSDRDPSRVISAVDANAVEISAGSEKVRVAFDPSTGLPVRQIHNETDMMGKPSEVIESFSDWREVGGIKLPYKIAIEQNGAKAGEQTVSEIKLNTGLNAAELSKKPEPTKK
jgi:hypothetical protein